MDVPDYGVDLSCRLDLDPLMRTRTGIGVVMDAAVNRLTSPPGSLLLDPLYGYDLRSLVNESGKPEVVAAIARAQVRTQLLRDERIDAVDFSEASFVAQTHTLRLAGQVTTGLGPFSFVFTLTPEKAELLAAPI